MPGSGAFDVDPPVGNPPVVEPSADELLGVEPGGATVALAPLPGLPPSQSVPWAGPKLNACPGPPIV